MQALGAGGIPGGVRVALSTDAHTCVSTRNNCKKDAVTIAVVNGMTSLCASIAVFSVLGFKAAKDHGRCLDR